MKRKAIVAIVTFMICLTAWSQDENIKSLTAAAKNGDVEALDSILKRSVDKDYLRDNGEILIEEALSLDVIKLLHENGAPLTEYSYYEHAERIFHSEDDDNLDILKYFIDNKAISKDYLFYITDGPIHKAILIWEYVKYLDNNGIKYDKKLYIQNMNFYFENARESYFYDGDESMMPVLRFFIKKGIGIDKALHGIGEGSYSSYPNMYREYIYFLDSMDLKLDKTSYRKSMEWICYLILEYAYDYNDTVSIDFLTWMVGEGILKEGLSHCFQEIGATNHTLELRYLRGLKLKGVDFSKKPMNEIIYWRFSNYVYEYEVYNIDYSVLVEYAGFIKNAKDPLAFIYELMDIKSVMEVFEIIQALNHSKNKVNGDNLIKAIYVIYETYTGLGDLMNYIDFIDQPLSDGRTILMIACDMNDDKTVKHLVEAGADVEIKDKDGKLAADYTESKKIKKLLNQSSD